MSEYLARIYTQQMLWPDAPLCDKTFIDCARHGNTLRFGGRCDAGPEHKEVPCPFVFNDDNCGAKKPCAS
jgi:hypothetical protein